MSSTGVSAPVGPGRPLSLWLLAAVVAYLALTWWFGGADTIASARRIGGAWIVAGMGLTAASFAIRAVRWHFLLRAMGRQVPAAASGAVYLAGIGLSATPGKLGETVRAAFLLRHGVPVGTTLAAFFADRLSDVVAVVLLAVVPAVLASGWSGSNVLPWSLVLALVLAAPLVLRWIVRTGQWPRVVDALARLKPLRRPADWLQRGAADFTSLWRPGVASCSIAASLLAYGLQAAIFAGMVHQVAPQVGVAACFGIFAAATLAGAASFVPGGLGAMELALVLLLREHGADGASALAAALCLRAVTFWFGLLLGAGGLSAAARLQPS